MRKLLGISTLLILTLFLGSCNIYKEPLRIGIDDEESAQFIKIAQHLGIYTDPMEVVEFKNSGDNVEAFYLGRLDIVYASIFDSVYFQGKGEEGAIFLLTSKKEKVRSLLVDKRKSDLAKLKVGMEADTDEYLELSRFFADHDIDINSINLVFSSEKNLKESFLAGSLDAIYLYKPFSQPFYDKGYIYEGSESIEELTEALIATPETLKRSKRSLRKLTEAWYTILYMRINDPDRYRELLEEVGFSQGSSHNKIKTNFYFKEDNVRLLKEKGIEEIIREKGRLYDLDPDTEKLYTGDIIR